MKVDEITSLERLQEVKNETRSAISELRDKYNSRKVGDGPGRWEDSEESTWTELNQRYDAIDKRMDQLRSSAEIESRWNEIDQKRQDENKGFSTGANINHDGPENPITEETRTLALQGWMRSQMESRPSQRQSDAMKQVGMNPWNRSLDIPTLGTSELRRLQQRARQVHHSRINELKPEKRAMASASSTLIPEGFVQQIEIAQLFYSSVMRVGDIIRTSSGNDLPWPTMNDTGNKGRLLAENTAVTPTDPTTSSVTLNAYKMSSDLILVAYELLEDEDLAPELPVVLMNALAERLGRIKEQYATSGTASSQPQGVVTGAAAGVTAASATAITADEIIELYHSVDPAYRMGASFMLHDSIAYAVRLLKDGDGQYLWQPGLQNGLPDRLIGAPVVINQEMDSALATTNDVMLFGDFSKVKIREVNNIRMYRLEERYRDSDQDGFVAFSRFDSKVLNAGTAPIKKLTMA